jgi:hypothetical protein
VYTLPVTGITTHNFIPHHQPHGLQNPNRAIMHQ